MILYALTFQNYSLIKLIIEKNNWFEVSTNNLTGINIF